MCKENGWAGTFFRKMQSTIHTRLITRTLEHWPEPCVRGGTLYLSDQQKRSLYLSNMSILYSSASPVALTNPCSRTISTTILGLLLVPRSVSQHHQKSQSQCMEVVGREPRAELGLRARLPRFLHCLHCRSSEGNPCTVFIVGVARGDDL